jgi:hypothetical protein
VIRERLGRLALRAYPREFARAKGPEMLSMMLEMSADSPFAFARELVSLGFCGLRERSRATAGSGRRQLATDACRAALLLYLAVPLWGELANFRLVALHDVEQLLIVLAVCAAFALLLAGYNRWAGLGGLGAIAIGVTVTALGQPPLANVVSPLVRMAIPALCCAVLAAAPGQRRPELGRLRWLVLPLFLALVFPASGAEHLILGLDYQQLFLAAASALGVLCLPCDPRLALGCGIAWAAIAVQVAYNDATMGFAQSDSWLIWLSAAILAAAATRLTRMRRA